MAERERHDPLLNERRELVGETWAAPLPRAQDLKAVPLDTPLPDVVGRTMDPEHPTRLTHRSANGVVEQLQPIAEQHVILRHAAHPFPSDLAVEGESEQRTRPGPTRRRPPLSSSKRRTRVSGPLGDSPA